MRSSARTDGGATSRVVGSLLNWLAEPHPGVFVIATANDVRELAPEQIREGRFTPGLRRPSDARGPRRRSSRSICASAAGIQRIRPGAAGRALRGLFGRRDRERGQGRYSHRLRRRPARRPHRRRGAGAWRRSARWPRSSPPKSRTYASGLVTRLPMTPTAAYRSGPPKPAHSNCNSTREHRIIRCPRGSPEGGSTCPVAVVPD